VKVAGELLPFILSMGEKLTIVRFEFKATLLEGGGGDFVGDGRLKMWKATSVLRTCTFMLHPMLGQCLPWSIHPKPGPTFCGPLETSTGNVPTSRRLRPRLPVGRP
jgi:hypothetical protein